MAEGERPRIVVGVDGSVPSIEALRWAARQAQLVGATLHVVTAWSYPEYPTPFGIVPELPLGPDPLAEARVRLDRAIAANLGRRPSVEVRAQVVSGVPVPVLLEKADGAALLVLGSRGRGAFAGMVLGSVSIHCLGRASCPVAVVPRSARGAQRPS